MCAYNMPRIKININIFLILLIVFSRVTLTATCDHTQARNLKRTLFVCTRDAPIDVLMLVMLISPAGSTHGDLLLSCDMLE